MTSLQDQYNDLKPVAELLLNELKKQLDQIITRNPLFLAVPIQGRVKSWDSIDEKLRRKDCKLDSVLNLPDLIGLRLIFLFSQDIRIAIRCVSESFLVMEEENAADRLDEDQFGYQSYHCVVQISEEQGDAFAFSGCDKFQIEIQLRTIAQHAWAVASHRLQYKRERTVPPSVRRSIHRVSALLEIVDLEFDRVLNEQEIYVTQVNPLQPNAEPLNVDILTAILDAKLPVANREYEEDFDQLIRDLETAGIVDVIGLTDLIGAQLERAIKRDHEIVEGKHSEYFGRTRKMKGRGTYFSHTGLVRYMLECIGKW